MTIKQQGGIFGRNPTFNEVTADTSVSVGSFTLENNRIKSDTTLLLEPQNNIAAVTPYDPNAATVFVVDAVGRTAFGISNTTLQLEAMGNDGATNRGSNYTITAAGTSAWGGSELRFGYFSDGVDYGTRMTLTNSGNLAFPSGKGIDFSATSGTGTSELFDDYEEGTFTCTDASGGGNAIVSNYAAYTKIGNAVTVSLYITVPVLATGAGALLGGLPYAPSTYNNILVAQNTGGLDIIAKTNIGGFFVIYPSGSASNSIWLDLAGDDVYITGTYYV